MIKYNKLTDGDEYMYGKSSFLKSLSERSLIALLIFSFICTLLGFGIAYNEHRSLKDLSDKYDVAIGKIDECQSELSALSEKVADMESATTIIITDESFTSEDFYHTLDIYPDTTDAYAKDEDTTQTKVTEATTAKASSGQYYVTQSGTKYHTSYCSYLSKSRIAVSLETIRSKGYSPCSRCIR